MTITKLLFISILLPIAAVAKTEKQPAAEPGVAIQEIRDKSASSHGDSCGFYNMWSRPGDAVRETLIDEMSSAKGFVLVEREDIDKIYSDEFRHENLDDSTKAESKKFIAAKYAISGVISEFEWCLSGQNQGIDVGGLLGIGELSVKHKSSNAHVAVNVRLIEVKTGKILGSFKGEGKVDDSGFGIEADAFGVRLNKDMFQKTPLGKATRMATADVAKQLVAELKKLN